MGSFEDSIKNSFDKKEVKAPAQVWSKVESSLNADLVSSYQSSQFFHKWVSAAAILIAFISLAFQYQPNYGTNTSQEYTGETYNGLLADQSNYLNSLSFSYTAPQFNRVLTYPVVIEKGRDDVADELPIFVEEPNEGLYSQAHSLALVKNDIQKAEVTNDIYPYHQGATYVKSKGRSREDNTKVWAGIEAGAGNFNTSLTGPSVFTGSIDQSSLASALGSEGFINPTANVNPDMDPGLATSIGLDFGMRLGNKWTLETGLAYTSVDSRGDASINVLDIYTIDNSDFTGTLNGDSELALPATASRQSTLEVQDSYDYDLDVRSNFRFTSIPMKAGYFVMDRKMSLRLNVGLAANYFVGSQLSGSGDVINGSANDLFNTWSFDGLGGLELGYSILDRFDVTLEPNYRQAITPLSESSNSSSRFIVQTGLRYKIQ